MIPGSLWISGCTLHYIDQNSNHQSMEGQLDQQIQSQVPGSIWAEQDGVGWYLCYICEEQHKHKLPLSQSEDTINQEQVPGSIWIDGSYINFVLETNGIKYKYKVFIDQQGS